jgi:hypothetical protein
MQNRELFLRRRLRWCLTGVTVYAACCYAQWAPAESDASSTPAQSDRSSYIIKRGDTLWDLAFKFLGDPFKWPELWHANSYITNPDLIFPGNTLVVPGVAGKAPEGGLPETESLTSLSAEAGGGEQRENPSGVWSASGIDNAGDNRDRFTDSLMRATVLRSDYFTPELIEQRGFLWFGKDAKGLIYPGNGAITKQDQKDPLKTSTKNIYRQFDDVAIRIFGKHSYKAGDTVDVYHSDRLVRFKGKTGNLVRRIARARLTAASATLAQAILFKTWDVVTEGDRIDTMARFPSWEIDTIVDRDVTVRGTVFERIEPTEGSYLFQTLICDRGGQDGVRFGDIFLVYPQAAPPASARPSALGFVCRVGEQTSTLVIEKLFDAKVNAGDAVDLFKRIRFK